MTWFLLECEDDATLALHHETDGILGLSSNCMLDLAFDLNVYTPGSGGGGYEGITTPSKAWGGLAA